MQSWGEGWECPAQEFCSCLLAAGVTLMQSLAEPTTPPFPSCREPGVWGRAQLCQLLEPDSAAQLGRL